MKEKLYIKCNSEKIIKCPLHGTKKGVYRTFAECIRFSGEKTKKNRFNHKKEEPVPKEKR